MLMELFHNSRNGIMDANEFTKKGIHNIKDELIYESGSVVFKSIMKKYTGSVTAFAFDVGKSLVDKVLPFNTMIQLIDGDAEIVINEESFLLSSGDSIIIPAHSNRTFFARSRFKMITTVIKSGFE